MKKVTACFILIFTFLFASNGLSFAKPIKTNATLEAVIILKILQYNETLKEEGEISFFIIDRPELGVQLEKAQGQTIGGIRIGRIEMGIEPPDKRYSVIYCGNPNQIKSVLEYSSKHKSLSVMEQPKNNDNRLTVTLQLRKSKPKIFYNKTQSKIEKMMWKREFLKLAKIVG